MAVSAGKTSIVSNGLELYIDAGTQSTTFPLSQVEVLVVGGGGGGGMDMGGGGGGGGVIYRTDYPVTPGTPITATVGNGGAGAPAAGTSGQPSSHQYTIRASSGQNSVFGNLIAIGGGYGASSYWGYTPDYGYAGSGGSGGGASGYSDGTGNGGYPGRGGRGGSGTSGQGYAGGGGTGQYASGGGGGAGEPGRSGFYNGAPKGGDGIACSILGTTYYWGGGGGGAGYSNWGGNGGLGGGGGGAVGNTLGGPGLNNGSGGGGGGTGTWANTPGGNAGANTGGGGGGGSHYNSNNKGGDGGSGIVVVRYPGQQKATGGNITRVNGYTIHTFTSSGTFTPLTAASLSSTLYGLDDLSGKNNHITFINGPTYNSGSGGYISFDGVDDYGTSGALPGTFSEFTVIIWFYPNSVANYQNPIDCNYAYNGSTGNIGPRLEMASGGNLGWCISGDTTNNSNLNGVTVVASGLSANTWHCAALTKGTTLSSYYNGSVVTSNASNSYGFVNVMNNVTLGKGFHLGGSERLFNGRIGIVQIYRRELSASEILQNFNAQRSRFGI